MANGGFDLSTPLAQLAWDIATRTNTAVEQAAQADPTIRKRLNEQLGRYGGNLADVEKSFEEYYKPGLDAYVAQMGAMRDYAVGLPELMAKAAKEGQTSGVTYKAPGVVTPFDFAKEAQKRKDIVQATDAIVAPTIISARPETPATSTYRPPQAGRLRPVRGNY